jgi:hypothetical protein
MSPPRDLDQWRGVLSPGAPVNIVTFLGPAHPISISISNRPVRFAGTFSILKGIVFE